MITITNKSVSPANWPTGIIGSLPFEGNWMVGNTPAKQVPSHGTDMLGVGYAIDFIAVDEQGRTSSKVSWRTLFATEPPDIFYAYGQPVLSPVTGTVVAAHDGELDHEARRSLLTLIPYAIGQASRLRDGVGAIAGNYVIVSPDSSNNYIAIVHLQRGSLLVAEGQRVTEGQHLANCGNSGNSTQPHIHIQAMDSDNLSIAHGVPLFFRRFSQKELRSDDQRVCSEAVPKANAVVCP